MPVRRTTEQINIRAPGKVLKGLRGEARRRHATLGETVEALLDLAQVERSRRDGLWLELPPATRSALAAVCAGRGLEQDELLTEWLGGWLRQQLEQIATALPSVSAVSPAASGAAPGLPLAPASVAPVVPVAPIEPAAAPPSNGAELAAWRSELGLAIRPFAELVGMSFSAVHKAEKKADQPLAPRLAAAVDRCWRAAR